MHGELRLLSITHNRQMTGTTFMSFKGAAILFQVLPEFLRIHRGIVCNIYVACNKFVASMGLWHLDFTHHPSPRAFSASLDEVFFGWVEEKRLPYPPPSSRGAA